MPQEERSSQWTPHLKKRDRPSESYASRREVVPVNPTPQEERSSQWIPHLKRRGHPSESHASRGEVSPVNPTPQEERSSQWILCLKKRGWWLYCWLLVDAIIAWLWKQYGLFINVLLWIEQSCIADDQSLTIAFCVQVWNQAWAYFSCFLISLLITIILCRHSCFIDCCVIQYHTYA